MVKHTEKQWFGSVSGMFKGILFDCFAIIYYYLQLQMFNLFGSVEDEAWKFTDHRVLTINVVFGMEPLNKFPETVTVCHYI